ncbi:MAG TPA: DNA alkylation repair protein [Gillisia sp.]|nr:DNA alkylation repair protein [Gillisia sp.]
MTQKEVFDQLKSLGDEKVFARNEKNGAGENQFGVKLGDLRKVAKKIKTDHTLALELWETGNLEARLVAILVMKPNDLKAADLDAMVRSLDVPQVADWFNAYVLKDHPEKDFLREKWLDSENVWAARSGWSLTAGKVARDPEDLDIDKLLNRIETEMPSAAPEVQWTMNTALAQIGINSPKHRDRAVKIGEQLGIYKDFPVSKGCTSPFAPIWINEMVSRQNK